VFLVTVFRKLLNFFRAVTSIPIESLFELSGKEKSMNSSRRTSKLFVVMTLSLLMVGGSSSVWAQRHRTTEERHRTTEQRHRTTEVRVERHRDGDIVRNIPSSHVVITHSGSKFIYSNGTYYRHHSHGYVVVRPPFGLRIRVLPFGYRRFFIGANPYYYSFGTYYSYDPATKVYVVCEKPAQAPAEVSDLDQITLIDGNTLDGVYLKGDGNIVEFEVEGKVREIPRSKISSITFAKDAGVDSTETEKPEQ
jgi:hypothetical protein